MQQVINLFLIASGFCLSISSASPSRSFLLDVARLEKDEKCLGIMKSFQCGDGICNSAENSLDCPEDCAPGWKPYSKQQSCPAASTLVTPFTIEEAIHFVKESGNVGSSMKACGAGHTIGSQCCTDGVQMIMTNLNQVEDLDQNGIVTVQAGIELDSLLEWLDARGRSLGLSIPGYRKMTVAGLISTGSHGSAIKETSVLASRVTSLDVISPFGVLQTWEALDANGEESLTFKALRVSLGLLGVIVRVRLQTEVKFSIRFESHVIDDSEFLSSTDLIKSNFQDADFGLIHYWPQRSKAVRVRGWRTTEPADETVRNGFICLPGVNLWVGEASADIMQAAYCSRTLKQTVEFIRSEQFFLQSYITKTDANNKTKSITSGVGNSYQVISDRGCTTEAWNDRALTWEWEAAIPIENATAALRYVKDFSKKFEVNLALFGFLVRFGPEQNTSLLAHSAGRQVMFMDCVDYKVKGQNPETYAGNDRDKINQLYLDLVSVFGARIHWGKNYDEAFLAPYGQLAFEDKWSSFLGQIKQLDPACMFTSKFNERLGFGSCTSDESSSRAIKSMYAQCASCQDADTSITLMCGPNSKTYFHPCSALCDGISLDRLIPGQCRDPVYPHYGPHHAAALPVVEVK